jgi:hypothetical protein
VVVDKLLLGKDLPVVRGLLYRGVVCPVCEGLLRYSHCLSNGIFSYRKQHERFLGDYYVVKCCDCDYVGWTTKKPRLNKRKKVIER